MRAFLLALAVVGMVASMTDVGFTQAKPSTTASIQGVWKITELVRTGANAANIKAPQPSLYIFTPRHYSIISVNGTQARLQVPAFKNPDKPSDAEKAATYDMWQPVTANAGTYEIKGTTITRRASVAKGVAVMTTAPPNVSEFKIQGDTLVLTNKSAAGQPVMARPPRLERGTPGLEGRCSIQLSYGRVSPTR
jgi:hypothetical protein